MPMPGYNGENGMSHWMIENWSGGTSHSPLIAAFAGPKGPCDYSVPPSDSDEPDLRRWRRVVLRMSDSFSAAAVSQPHLAPYLLEAMGHALEQLLLFGREKDLDMLDEWLNEGGHST